VRWWKRRALICIKGWQRQGWRYERNSLAVRPAFLERSGTAHSMNFKQPALRAGYIGAWFDTLMIGITTAILQDSQ
jgi:hypothetical protein